MLWARSWISTVAQRVDPAVMDEESLWQLERALWLHGQEFHRRWLDPAALMLFPAPAGMMNGEAAIDALGAAPRWVRVEMAERHAFALSQDAAALAYRASASRGGDDCYEALCSSIYRKAGDIWLLCLHQQTLSAKTCYCEAFAIHVAG